jgi:hypothetical protein
MIATPVEDSDGIAEGSHVADVRPQTTFPQERDEFTQLGAIGYDDEVDSQAISGPRVGRTGDGHQIPFEARLTGPSNRALQSRSL